jgi:hypothetical protein
MRRFSKLQKGGKEVRQEVKVKITLSEGYQERFTRACIKVAQKRIEGGSGERSRRKDAKKVAEAV